MIILIPVCLNFQILNVKIANRHAVCSEFYISRIDINKEIRSGYNYMAISRLGYYILFSIK